MDSSEDFKILKTKVFEALGEASMCWEPRPEGVFDSTHAQKIGEKLMQEIEYYFDTFVAL